MTTPATSSLAATGGLRVARVEIGNFRRLDAVSLMLETDTTVLVGANNSGKTAVMLALRRFVSVRRGFSPLDISGNRWSALRKLGESWETRALDTSNGPVIPDEEARSWQEDLRALNEAMPYVDIWLDVQPGSFHHVAHLIPTLDWSAGLLGVRLRLEPAEDVAALQALAWSYRRARDQARTPATGTATTDCLTWPTDLIDYWRRLPYRLGGVAAYKLDPAKLCDPDQSSWQARPQQLPEGVRRLDGDPFAKVLRVDFVSAQRGLGTEEAETRGSGGDGTRPGIFSRRLVDLAKGRFDFTTHADENQRRVWEEVTKAETRFDEVIGTALADVTKELNGVGGYPGMHDPQAIRFRTQVPVHQLFEHATAIQYQLDAGDGANVHLPEHGIGLGYQNLQFLTYHLFDLRQRRLSSADGEPNSSPVPVHLVLLEEPEAHLHVQVQRVFAERGHDLLKPKAPEHAHLVSQLVITTHSSHLAHSLSFAKLRYVRRTGPASAAAVPSSAVVGLGDVFGGDDETRRFVERYLRIQHSDLLFADAAIFIEGTAERLLVPQFVERDWPGRLAVRYLSYLEVGGSHAHRLRPLVERLGLPTLVITDLDAAAPDTNKKRATTLGSQQITTNPTLKKWLPKETKIDELLSLPPERKAAVLGAWSGVHARVAYQIPNDRGEPCATSFEDAIVLENQAYFQALAGHSGPLQKMHHAVSTSEPGDLATNLHAIVSKDFAKAEFALELLMKPLDTVRLKCPRYIREGLDWLDEQLASPRGGAALSSEV